MDNEKEYSRYMSDFRGIDATSEASNVALNRFSFIQNMYKDYKSGQGVAIETFPGTRTLKSNLGGKIYGIHPYKVSSDKTYIIVHAGDKLYYLDGYDGDATEFSDIEMNDAKSSSFIYNNRLYLIDGKNYISVYKYGDDLKAEKISQDNAYIPTTFAPVETKDGYSISATSEYEQRNMLTSKFKERTYLDKLMYNVIEIAPTNDNRSYLYSAIDNNEEVTLHPYISHQLYTYYSNRSCYCGCSIDYLNKNYKTDYSNKLYYLYVEIPAGVKKLNIDFKQIIICWGCGANKYYRSSDSTTTFYSNQGAYHGTDKEVVTIEELRDRKNNANSKYYYSMINDRYLGGDGERNLRTVLKTIEMENNVESITGNFENCSNLTKITLSDNITKLEERFFAGTAIETAYLPFNLQILGNNAFEGCSKLKSIYASAKKIIYVEGAEPTSMYNLLTINKGDYGIGENVTIISYESMYMNGIPHGESISDDEEKVVNRVYIKTPCKSIDSVFVNNAEVDKMLETPNEKTTLYSPVTKYINGKRHIIAIDFYNTQCDEYVKKQDEEGNYYDTDIPGYSLVNGIVEIQGEAHESVFTTSEDAADESKDVLSSHKEYGKSAIEAIKGCTVCCTFDDRIFFTGNPDLPNTVFYTHRDLSGHVNPTYVGVLNWFDDGIGNEPNVAMMTNATTLMVLKGNTMQDGSVYYHVGADGGNDITPRIYPSTEGLSGLGCVGMAVNFRDDCVFMSSRGLEAIAKQTVNLERTFEHRSTNIDGLLLQCDLKNARAAEWEGYLCILIDGQMFLADSRQMFEGIGGAVEYEWYYVNPVCGYDGDNEKYYLADYMPEEIQQRKDEGLDIDISDAEDRSVDYSKVHGGDMCNCHNNVVDASYTYTIEDEDGNEKTYPIYYVERDGVKYLVDSDGERENGTPDKAVEICAIGDVLLFGTESGKLLCLNTDKRGTDDNEPDKSRIPMKYYNNSGHAYDAVAVLAMENAGVPHFTKSTVKRGTVLRLKSFPRSAFEIYATTDRTATTLLSKQSNSITTFDELDFANLGLLTTDSGILAIKEKTKKWVEKQYKLIGKEYNKPWGLYSLAYRYIIAGGVKNQ